MGGYDRTVYRCGCSKPTTYNYGTPRVDHVENECFECRSARTGQVIEFVRFGKPPVSGFSTNGQTGELEAGVSVYELIENKPVFVGFYCGIYNRPAFTGTGRIVGWGSDGEPVVEILKIKRNKKFD